LARFHEGFRLRLHVIVENNQDRGTLGGLTHATGLNLVAGERWNFGVSAEAGALRDSETSARTLRRATGFRLGYGADRAQLSSGIEYRLDDTEQLDATRAKRTSWLFRSNFKFLLSPGSRLLGKWNNLVTNSSLGQLYDGGYTEAVVGYAYRPVNHDRLNAMAKYTYFYNVPAADQLTLNSTNAAFIQTSHIASVDLTVDVLTNVSVGTKFAYRLGQASLDRQQFFDSTARLAVLRLDWRFHRGWESLVEARTLDLPNASQHRRGALGAIYRHLGQNLKIGAGYNFSDFSDDLTDLRYNHKGVFLNILGTL
jgi:hypothetical protein